MHAKIVAREAGGEVLVANSHGSVLRVLTMLGMKEILVSPSVEATASSADKLATQQPVGVRSLE